MEVIAVVQARMGSSRFPGKMMKKIGRHSIIEWVLHRVKMAKSLKSVVMATSCQPENKPLLDVAHAGGCEVIIGPEQDVLSRFLLAADRFKAHHYVRVCADNPFVCPYEIDKLVSFHLEQGFEYSFNHIPALENGYVNGLGCEIFSRYVLDSIAEKAPAMPIYREHVTSYLWEHLNQFKIGILKASSEVAFPGIKLDVDYPHDLFQLKTVETLIDISMRGSDIIKAFLGSPKIG